MQGPPPSPPASRRRANSKDSDPGAALLAFDASALGGSLAAAAGAKAKHREGSPSSSPSPKPGAVRFDEDVAFGSPLRGAFALPLHGGSLYNTPVPVRVGGFGIASQTPIDMEILPTSPASGKVAKKLFTQQDDSQPNNDAAPLLATTTSNSQEISAPPQPVDGGGEKDKSSAASKLGNATPLEPLPPSLSASKAAGVGSAAKSSGRVKRTKSSELASPAAAASPALALPLPFAASVPKESTRPCNCKKSHCLKLYCECFAANLFCGPNCKCAACENNNEPENLERRKQAMAARLLKSPTTFAPKVVASPEAHHHARGCKCLRSGCTKKYCECFASGVSCTSACKCSSCQNRGTSPRPDIRGDGSGGDDNDDEDEDDDPVQ